MHPSSYANLGLQVATFSGSSRSNKNAGGRQRRATEAQADERPAERARLPYITALPWPMHDRLAIHAFPGCARSRSQLRPSSLIEAPERVQVDGEETALDREGIIGSIGNTGEGDHCCGIDRKRGGRGPIDPVRRSTGAGFGRSAAARTHRLRLQAPHD